MAKFLSSGSHSGNIRNAVKDILAGSDPIIASAFLGRGAENKIKKNSRVLCDVSMGGTNPKVLEDLLEKLPRKNLRHLPNFHAKVYMSDVGCLIGSANLSNNGIGFLRDSALSEAATLHEPNSPVALETRKWFEALWDDAEPVTPDVIEEARAKWNASKRGAPEDGDDQEQQNVWRYIVTREEFTPKERDEINAYEDEMREKRAEASTARSPVTMDCVTNMSKRKKLDGYYILVHRGPRGRVYYQAVKFITNRTVDGTHYSHFEVVKWPARTLGLKKDFTIDEELINTADEDKLIGRALASTKFHANF